MKFQDSGPIIAICDLLFDAVRALFPSWFPEAYPFSKGPNSLTVVLTRLDDKAGDIGRDIQSIMNVVQGPAPVPQESIVKLLSDVRTEMRDAFSKLPEPVSAFPKAPGTGMHGSPSG